MRLWNAAVVENLLGSWTWSSFLVQSLFYNSGQGEAIETLVTALQSTTSGPTILEKRALGSRTDLLRSDHTCVKSVSQWDGDPEF